MPRGPRAAIDVGSNSLLLTIVDEGGRVLHDEARVVGLGRGLGDRGLFATDRMQAALQVLSDYTRIAQQHAVAPSSIAAVATSAARRAMNAQTFFSRVLRIHGIRIRIISGEEEARLTWLGALRELDVPAGPVAVVDVGGGSTEVVLGVDGQVLHRVSLELGSVRLTEAFFSDPSPTLPAGVVDPAALGRLRTHVGREAARMRLDPAPRTLIAVAGSATTLAAMRLGLTRYDPERVHGCRLTAPDLSRFVDLLLPANAAQRRALAPSAPDRADFLLAACAILQRVLAGARRQHMIVSDRGLRYGLLASAGPTG